MDGPPGKPHYAQVIKVGYSADPPGKNRNGRFLHGEVVVVACLGLPVFECTLSGGAFSEEKIGIGMPRDFQPCTQPRIVRSGCTCLTRTRRSLLKPQLGQRQQALFV